MSPVEEQSENKGPFPWRWLGLTLALVLARALPNLRFPIGRDQATCCVIAQRMLEGLHLYRELLDNRPPGIYWLYMPFVKLLGPVMWIAAAADILVVLVTAAVVFVLARRLLGTAAAVIGTVLAASFHCSSGYVSAAQPDGLLMVFVFAACLLVASPSSPRMFTAGVLLAAAFWVKYNALAFFPWVIAIGWVDRPALDGARPRLALRLPVRASLGRLMTLLAGFSAVSVLVLASFALSGSWAAFRESQFDVLLRYSSASLGEQEHGIWALVIMYFYVGPWNPAVVALALVVAWWSRELGRIGPIVLGFVCGMAAVLLPGKLHSYYVEMVLPFYALCWGYVLIKILEVFRRGSAYLARRGFRIARALAWVVVANLAFAGGFAEGFRVYLDYQSFAGWARNPRASYSNYAPQHKLEKLADQLSVIEFVKSHSQEGDQLYVWGTAPLINFLSQRQSPTRIVSNLGLISPWGPEHWRAELVRDLGARPPHFIVVARRDAIPSVSQSHLDSEQFLATYPELAGLISSRYEPAAHFRSFEVYRRK